METNSIERIWKEALVSKSSATNDIAVNINNIKSIHFIDKFKSVYRQNIIGLLITGIIILLAFSLGGVPIEGLILFTLFAFLSVVGYRKLNELNKLNKELSTYEYIKAFRNWFLGTKKRFQLIYSLIYPALFLVFALAFLRTTFFVHFLDETLWGIIVSSSNTYLYKGLPILYLLIPFIIAIIISVFSKKLSTIDIDSLYGKMNEEIETLFDELSEDN